MKKHIIISRVREYVGRHWFKLILLLLIVIACFRKDLNFSLSLNSANKNKKVEQKKNSTETQTPATLQKEANESTPLSILGTFLGTEKKTDEFPDIRFPCMANARAFWNSRAYQEQIRPLRLNPPAGDYIVTVYPEAPLRDDLVGKVGENHYSADFPAGGVAQTQGAKP